MLSFLTVPTQGVRPLLFKEDVKYEVVTGRCTKLLKYLIALVSLKSGGRWCLILLQECFCGLGPTGFDQRNIIRN